MRFTKTKIFVNLIFLATIFSFYSCSTNKKESFNKENFFSKATLKTEREKFLIHTIDETILKNLSFTLSNSTEKKYQSAFWAIELIQYRNVFTDSVVKNSFMNLNKRSIGFQRSFLELVYTLYKGEYFNQMETFSKQTDNPKIFAICLSYLKDSGLNLNLMLSDYIKKNPESSTDPIITMLSNDLDNKSITPPSLMDLLKNDFQGNTTVFSIQRSNRDYPGLAVIKKPDGKFLREKSGEIFFVQQLARAITNLPGYITNGNTPAGIFSMQGIDSSKNIFIGPSPNLQLVLPFEVNPITFFHNKNTDTLWNEELYNSLLPESWKNYFPIHTAYYAGKAGRTEIIAHGTTIDPGFYNGKSYFPFTPSLGCLTTKEIWSNENGKLIESDQIKFMNAIKQTGAGEGFFIVVDIDDKNTPVNLNEVKSLIIEAEK